VRDEERLNLIRALIVEFIGPFTLVLAGAGAIVITQGKDLVAIALAHGLAIGLMVAAAGHISGGVYNPAITCGLLLARKLTPVQGISYIVAQLLGGVAAAFCLKGIFPSQLVDATKLGAPVVGPGVGTWAALTLEIIMTFFLMFVIYGTAVDERGPRAIAPLAIGLTITMDIFFGGGISGAVMNPARQLGPALVQNVWSNWWIWWVGPIVGALIAADLYAYVLQVRGREPRPDVLEGDIPRDRRV
jgi:MIP family channel proteins